MKPLPKTVLASSLFLLSALLSMAHAGQEAPPPAIALVPSVPSWELRAGLYGWLTGLDGTIDVGSLSTDVDESFGDIIGDIEMVAALQVEARRGRWGILADGLYVELGNSGNPPGSLYRKVDADMTQFTGELSIAYRLYDHPRGFVDVYAGMRYNNLSLDLTGTLNPPGIQDASNRASERIIDALGQRVEEIVNPKVAAFQAGSAEQRAGIESALTATIEAEAEGRVKQDLEKQLAEIRRNGGLDSDKVVLNRISREVRAERLELARSTSQLEIAQLRASVDSSVEGEVVAARSRVDQAEQKLATAINNRLADNLPRKESRDRDWLDPIVGFRAQWNITDRWFLAAKSDIGGFGVGSDLAWTLQSTVGYNFTEKVSAELGYRYMHTDYTRGDFVYDVAQAGIYTSLTIRF